MNTQVRFFAFIVFVSTIAQISVEMYAPSLPYISNDLRTSDMLTQLTITSFLFGMIAFSLFFGYMADHIGRKKILLLCSIIGFFGTLICCIAPNIYYLIAGRFVQGVGFGGAAGVSRAILRDKFNGFELAQYAAYLGMATSLAIDLSPFIGGFIQNYFNWRVVFIALLLYSAIIIYVSYKYQDTRPTHPGPIPWHQLFSTVRVVFRDKNYLRYNLIIATIYGMVMSYLAVMSFVIQEVLHYSAAFYGTLALALSVIFIIFGFINGKLLRHIAILSLIKFGLWLCLLSGTILLYCGTVSTLTLTLLLMGVVPFWISGAFIWSNCESLSFADMKQNIGIASAIGGSIRFSIGVIVTAAISLFSPLSTMPFAILVITLCGVSLRLVYLDKRILAY